MAGRGVGGPGAAVDHAAPGLLRGGGEEAVDQRVGGVEERGVAVRVPICERQRQHVSTHASRLADSKSWRRCVEGEAGGLTDLEEVNPPRGHGVDVAPGLGTAVGLVRHARAVQSWTVVRLRASGSDRAELRMGGVGWLRGGSGAHAHEGAHVGVEPEREVHRVHLLRHGRHPAREPRRVCHDLARGLAVGAGPAGVDVDRGVAPGLRPAPPG